MSFVIGLVANLAIALHAGATSVTYSVSPGSGGSFQYSLMITEVGPPNQPIAGLNLIDAGPLFGLTPSSTIEAPEQWAFFPPDSGAGANELNFFSLDPAADVPVNASLGGFSFLSFTNPSSLGAGNFIYDLVPQTGPNCCTGTVTPQIPEPPTILLLLSAGALGSLCTGKIRRIR